MADTFPKMLAYISATGQTKVSGKHTQPSKNKEEKGEKRTQGHWEHDGQQFKAKSSLQ